MRVASALDFGLNDSSPFRVVPTQCPFLCCVLFVLADSNLQFQGSLTRRLASYPGQSAAFVQECGSSVFKDIVLIVQVVQ